MRARRIDEEERPKRDTPVEVEDGWSLVIPTLNRFDILCEAVRSALEQTLPPKEIVIVDAGVDAAENGIRLGRKFDYQQTRLVYIATDKASSAIQRNIGIKNCTADIIFFIDDDCRMYPNYAETIMAVYRADRTLQVAGTLGSLAPEPYPPRNAQDEPELDGRLGKAGFWNRLREIILGRMTLFPYLGGYPRHERPNLDIPFSYRLCRQMPGGYCSYRRSVIEQVLFDQDLIFYVCAEDADASYRASFQGALLEVPSAKVFHLGHPSSSRDFYTSTLVKFGNNAFWIQKHNPQRFGTKLSFLIRFARYLPGEALSDLFDLFHLRKMSFPKIRACVAALWLILRLFSMPSSQVSQWYRGFLESRFRRRSGANGPR